MHRDMRGTITITFRTKHTAFPTGVGYKVPQKFTPWHLTYSDSLSTLFSASDWGWNDTMARKLLASACYQLPAIVWAERSPIETQRASQANAENALWAIEPVGNGFMSDLSRTYQI